MIPSFKHILLVGCGKMGGALLHAWAAKGMAASITVVDPAATPVDAIRFYQNLDALPADYQPDCILLAAKPQSLSTLLPAYAARFEAPLYISIAAGKTLAFYENLLGASTPLIRAMPNTPAMIQQGITVLCANAHITEQHRQGAESLMQAVGNVEWLQDENLMDAVTAISGSGPAYVFYFTECLVEAGIKAGLPAVLAKQLAVETVRGSSGLASASHEASLAALRQQVTSPGGTTEAALEVLMKTGGLAPLIEKAVQQAIARSRELAE